MDHRKAYLEKADLLKPTLHVETVHPIGGLPDRALGDGDNVVLDFGNHFVGRVTLKLGYFGSHPDAPTWLRLKFCESSRELDESLEDYRGWISKGWVQEEQIHVDVLPCELRLPRRYAFRYLRVDMLATSQRYQVTLDDAWIEATTSADDAALAPYRGMPDEATIDRIAVRTLRNCMQDVFEDGPKRDRRLWLGDLRLQALANYATFKNNNLVKRCLYLFAAAANDDGLITACLFTEPELEGDDNWLADYSLFYISTLKDYVEYTGDVVTGRDLLPVALTQLELAETYFDPRTQLVYDDRACYEPMPRHKGDPRLVDSRSFFIDWNLDLNKQAAGQAIWIYCAKDAVRLLSLLGETQGVEEITEKIRIRSEAAFKYLYDAEGKLFLSGEKRQVSWASQVWFALADVLPEQDAYACLRAVAQVHDATMMVTPYMVHHYVDSLYKLGHPEEAKKVMMDYWGGMVKQGADTFYELYNPKKPDESPYGSPVVNSYCHAWSCTPAYFMRCQFE